MYDMKKIVVFTGAGVSADSGLATFRDADGLWASYRIEDVCTPEALARNRALVIEFYNKRRKELLGVEPNAAHRAIAELEKYFDVEVVTQNVDNLHERAGSTRVTHLHGELVKLRSQRNPDLIVPIEGWGWLSVASSYRILWRVGTYVRSCVRDSCRCRFDDCRRYIAGCLPRCYVGALRKAGSAYLCCRSGYARYIDDSQSTDSHQGARCRGYADAVKTID